MLFGYFWGDWTFLILIPAMIFAFVAQSKVNSTFNRYAKVYNRRGLTGAEAARRVLDANGLYHVTIERVHGRLTDHYQQWLYNNYSSRKTKSKQYYWLKWHKHHPTSR